jgi:hypothetical protein
MEHVVLIELCAKSPRNTSHLNTCCGLATSDFNIETESDVVEVTRDVYIGSGDAMHGAAFRS